MPKQIETLVEDIYELLNPNTQNRSFSRYNIEQFGGRLATHISNRLAEFRDKPTLRMSNIGTECYRKLWYNINTPEKAEPLSPAVRFKFLFGDILEELLLFLAKEAGHTVEYTQQEVEINGVKGHLDAVIDSRLVDVKSASSYSYRKFVSNGLREEDPFGYMDQLNAYLYSLNDTETYVDKDLFSFLVVDKTLGNICLDTYTKSDVDYPKKVEELKEMISQPEPPAKHYEDEPEGKSGNRKLGVQCSYCSHKFHCWENLRVFAYANKPMFLTSVVKEPKVMEITNS